MFKIKQFYRNSLKNFEKLSLKKQLLGVKIIIVVGIYRHNRMNGLTLSTVQKFMKPMTEVHPCCTTSNKAKVTVITSHLF